LCVELSLVGVADDVSISPLLVFLLVFLFLLLAVLITKLIVLK
jgi:hypothetical protein